MSNLFATSGRTEMQANVPAFSWARTLMDNGASWISDLPATYFDGDFDTLGSDDKLDLVLHPGPSFPYPVTLVTSQHRYVFCRSWNHIRDNNEDFIEIKYVQQGTFSITQMGSTHSVGAGQFVFLRSRVPFRWESLPSYGMPAKFFSILLPPDIVHSHFPGGVPLNLGFSAPPNQKLAMPSLFTLLYEQGSRFDTQVAKHLVTVILEEARLIAEQQGIVVDSKKTICDERIEQIITYIQLHLANPLISLSSVARDCGISPRYVSYLLKLRGTTFTNFLWEERLRKARHWLLTLDAERYSISEIAYMTGFKTPAHFSRLFRSFFDCSPRKFRVSPSRIGHH